MCQNNEAKMQLPSNIELPYFAYGLFKPGELAFNQIKDFVSGVPQEMTINGSLLVRDGLPLLKLATGGKVKGFDQF